ncbi:group I intron-associated PD-(D/E)XK endonuclease [Salinigranum halophilum]|jgi:hypothetical protein|uniref:group I intron-associated PD-(D/E)XK endonuclease n=1 Tax=Salinigranum halophilum TaxID=2565931 RepID=UPI0013764122
MDSVFDPKSKGERIEAVILAELVHRGLTVLTPFGENHRYDFVIETSQGFNRLQCKSARDEGEVIRFSTRSTRPRANGYDTADYDRDIDYFITTVGLGSDVYLVPIEDASKNEMVLRKEPPANNQSKGINWADEYRLDAHIDRLRGHVAQPG